jgi:hypothetical protein
MAVLLYEFSEFPEERDAIGQMLMAYGEIEFGLLTLIATVMDDDNDLAAKILFRVRGEGARIDVSDAIIRTAYYKVGLGPKWENALGAIKVCKKIRNQYAHCHWQIWDKKLKFIDFDVDARSSEDEITINFMPTDLRLLQKQVEHFLYALNWIYYLETEYKKRAGRLESHDRKEPKSIPAPPLYIQPS